MEQLDNIGVKSPLYDYAQIQRQVYQDAIGGTAVLRAKAGTYLPQFPREQREVYAYRCKMATAFNLTKKTRDVMVGLMFQNPIELQDDVPAAIRELWEDTDNQGNHGDVFWRRAAELTFEGYAFVLEDAPTYRPESAEEGMILGIRPYSVLFGADDIWNWRYRFNPFSQRRELEMIVLRCSTFAPDGDFKSKTVTRYLHSTADLNGVASWAYYLELREGNKVEYVKESEGIYGAQNSIPGAIIGELGGLPLLLDIAYKNFEHSETYSDYKSIIHKTCVPFPTRIGYQQTDGDSDVTNDSILDVPEGGDFKMVEVAGTSINAVRQSLIDNREDISLMGLSILADKTAKVDITATEALLNNIGETAELRVLARALQDAMELSSGFRAKYLMLGKDAGGSYVLGAAWNETTELAISAPVETPSDAKSVAATELSH